MMKIRTLVGSHSGLLGLKLFSGRRYLRLKVSRVEGLRYFRLKVSRVEGLRYLRLKVSRVEGIGGLRNSGFKVFG